MIETIKRLFGFGKPDPDKGLTLVVNSEQLERRVALVEDGRVEEYNVEREGELNIVGGIFKGRVKNIEQGLKAMFVDIGLEKNAFLHFWDAIPAALDNSMEEIKRSDRPSKKRNKISSKDIPSLYPVGSEIMVQVSKGAIGTKGPRVTSNISIAGRYLVLMPFTDQFGISRKIEDPKERARLRDILLSLNIPDGMGVIMRTVCQGHQKRHIVRDLAMLLEQWENVVEKRDNQAAPVSVYEEPDLITRTAQNFVTDTADYLLCDDEETTEYVKSVVGKVSKRAKSRVHFYPSKRSIFEKLGVQKQIDDAFQRQVWLNCGGYLVIDETEALISIDVNTGRNRGSKNVDKMILETNLEAAEEIARQLRLRNIGGLVVCDFIDMRHRKDQQQVYRMMRDRLKRDKARTQVSPISPLGLMEMTRQRLHESLLDTMYETCAYCNGRGRIKTAMSMSVEIQRKLSTIIARNAETEQYGNLVVLVNHEVLNRFKKEDSKLLYVLERKHTGRLIFKTDPKMHREHFAILDEGTQEVIEKV